MDEVINVWFLVRPLDGSVIDAAVVIACRPSLLVICWGLDHDVAEKACNNGVVAIVGHLCKGVNGLDASEI